MNNLLLEFDKAGAEWVVVAYLSGDARMLSIIREGKSPHVVTGSLISGVDEELVSLENDIVGQNSDPHTVAELRNDPRLSPLFVPGNSFFLPRTMSIRQAGKKSNHGLNYGMKFRRFALENEMDEKDSKIIVDNYAHKAYTGLPLWWESIRDELKRDRTLTNCFGRKVRLLDEWGDDLFNAAYSFKPQSTIGDMVNRAIVAAYEDYSPAFYPMDLLTQTHDSATVQYPTDDWTLMAEFCIKFGLHYMSPEIEYNSRKFTVGTDLKVGVNWGDMHKVKLTENIKDMADGLQSAWEKCGR